MVAQMGNYMSVYFVTRAGQKMPERLTIYASGSEVPESLPYWCIMVDKSTEEMNVDESRNKVCL